MENKYIVIHNLTICLHALTQFRNLLGWSTTAAVNVDNTSSFLRSSTGYPSPSYLTLNCLASLTLDYSEYVVPREERGVGRL